MEVLYIENYNLMDINGFSSRHINVKFKWNKDDDVSFFR